MYKKEPVEGYIFLKFKYEYNVVPQALFVNGIDESKTLLYKKTPTNIIIQNTDKDFDYFIYYDFNTPTPLFFFQIAYIVHIVLEYQQINMYVMHVDKRWLSVQLAIL